MSNGVQSSLCILGNNLLDIRHRFERKLSWVAKPKDNVAHTVCFILRSQQIQNISYPGLPSEE
jgi:hypothetical protein